MKKTALILTVFIVVFLQVYSAHAINVDISKEILNEDNITQDKDWTTIDLSQYRPWESKVRSLYILMVTSVASDCVGDTVYFYIRPFGDEANIRIQSSRSTSLDLNNEDDFIQYVWLPLNSNKIEYKIESIACPSANVHVRLWIVGYEKKDSNRWKSIYTGGTTPPQPDTISSGLKIFVTSRVHNGNFLSDPTLTGGTAIAKADNFCQTDPNRPTNAAYKALLVDGKSRDAVTPVDWVLRPNTAYYQTLNNVRVGVTTSTAVFATASTNLEHSVHDSFGTSNDPDHPAPTSNVWTGLAEASMFSASQNNCQDWTTSLNPDYSTIGLVYATDASAFYTNGGHSCTFEYRLYCVEQ